MTLNYRSEKLEEFNVYSTVVRRTVLSRNSSGSHDVSRVARWNVFVSPMYWKMIIEIKKIKEKK